jgi:ABC-type transporter MlaC component
MRERMVYGTESVSGERATVSLTLARGQEDVPIVADMVRRGTSWRVYDLRLRGVSLLDNYRAQLDRLMRQGTYEETIERLQTKREALRLTVRAHRAAPKE